MTIGQQYARLIHWLESNPPVAMPVHSNPRFDHFDDAQAWWKEFAQQVGMFNGEYARHLAGSMPTNVDAAECGRVIQEAVEGTDVFCSLSGAADQVLEAAE